MTAPEATAAAQPSGGVRSLISYLIFLHFFFLLVGIKSNTSSSGLDQDLRNKVPGLKPYLQVLALDLSYMFHLTYYDGDNFQDTDHFVEADLKLPDGTTKQVVFGGLDLAPGARMRHYERLAYRAAFFADNQSENMVSLYSQALARRIMLENPGCRELTLRLRRRLLVNRLLDPTTPAGRIARESAPTDPSFLQTVYEARALMNDQGEVSVAQVKAEHDTAAPQATTPTGTPQPTGTASPSSTVPAATMPAPTARPTATGGLFSSPLSFPPAAALPTPPVAAPTGVKP